MPRRRKKKGLKPNIACDLADWVINSIDDEFPTTPGAMPTWQNRLRLQPCFYCNKPSRGTKMRTRSTIDHIVPSSRGGANIATNAVACCYRCNNEKAAMTLSQWCEYLWAKQDIRFYAAYTLVSRPIKPLEENKSHWMQVQCWPDINV